jgi:hypothetical protein
VTTTEDGKDETSEADTSTGLLHVDGTTETLTETVVITDQTVVGITEAGTGVSIIVVCVGTTSIVLDTVVVYIKIEGAFVETYGFT